MQVLNPQGVSNCERYYSGVKVGNMIFTAGRIAFDAEGKVIRPNNAAAQTRHIMEDITRILKAGGATLEDIVLIHTYVLHPEDMPSIHKARQQYMDPHRPPHTGIDVQNSSWEERGIRVEIEVIAVII